MESVGVGVGEGGAGGGRRMHRHQAYIQRHSDGGRAEVCVRRNIATQMGRRLLGSQGM